MMKQVQIKKSENNTLTVHGDVVSEGDGCVLQLPILEVNYKTRLNDFYLSAALSSTIINSDGSTKRFEFSLFITKFSGDRVI